MNNLFFIFIFVNFTCQATIFGLDDRIDISQVKNETILEISKSIPALVQRKFLKSLNDYEYEIISRSFVDELGFCKDERFVADQSLLANCSAFLVGEDLIGTAAHCFSPEMQMGLKDYAVVFDYKADNNGRGPKRIKKNNVYFFDKFIKKEFEWKTFKDYALLKLTTRVEDRKPLVMSPRGRVEIDTPLYILGYPLGLPLKYQPSGKVISTDFKNNSFRHQLDTFSVNSGSAVFNANTNEIVGIHVRGTGLNYTNDKNAQCNRWGKGKTEKDWGEANFIDLLL